MNGEREAAERQCELGGETCGAMEPHKPEIMAGAALCGGCGRRRAAAKYTLVPADDATKLDEAWLRSVGFDVDAHQAEMQLPEFWHPDWPDDRTRTSLIVHFDGTVFVSQGQDEAIQWPVPLKTRGDLRRLCTALGIPLP